MVSVESDIDQPTLMAATFYSIGSPAIASGDGEFLVVWSESHGFNIDIVATRFRASDGAVLDPLDFLVASTNMDPSQAQTPAVAFDGTNFLVAYIDGAPHIGIHAVRVRPDGTVIDQGPILVTSAGNAESQPQLSFGSGTYLLSWLDNRSGQPAIYGRRVLPDGTVPDSTDILIEPANTANQSPTIDFASGTFLIAWSYLSSTSNYVRARRVRASDAHVLDASALTIATGGMVGTIGEKVTSDGSSFLIVWVEYVNGAILSGRLVDASTGGLGATVTIRSTTYETHSHAISWDGSHFVASWFEFQATGTPPWHVARFDSNLNAIDPPGGTTIEAIASNGDQATAFGSSRIAVIWPPRSSSVSPLLGALVDPATLTMTSTAPSLLDLAENGEEWPQIVAGSSGTYLAAWINSSPWLDAGPNASTNQDVVAARLRSDGTMLDARPIRIHSTPWTGNSVQPPPAVASNGSDFLVAYWSGGVSNANIYGSRVRGRDGVVLDHFVISSTASSAPGIGAVHDRYLVAFPNNASNENEFVRVDSATGAILDNPQSPIPGTFGLSSVACDGISLCVVFEVQTPHPPLFQLGAYATRVDMSTGYLLDTTPIVVDDVPDCADDCRPGIAFDGTNFLLVYAKHGTILGRRLAPSGVLLESAPIVISSASTTQRVPSVAFDGRDFIVVWSDQRDLPTQTTMTSTLGLWATRVSTAGAVLDGRPAVGGFPIARDIYRYPLCPAPRIASLGARTSIVLFQRDMPHPPVKDERIRKAIISNPDPLGTICTSTKTCASGYCVDGVCCNSACGSGDMHDCQACSRAAGAAQDGQCGLIRGSVCRQAAGSCAVGVCTGSSASCSSDQAAPAGTICQMSTQACVAPSVCDGTSLGCPPLSMTCTDASVEAGSIVDSGSLDGTTGDLGGVTTIDAGEDAEAALDASGAEVEDASFHSDAAGPHHGGCICVAERQGGQGRRAAPICLALLLLSLFTRPSTTARALRNATERDS
jgi:hypothetical protein